MQVVSRDIRRILTQRAYYFNIVLDDVSITNLTFSKEYTHAVERKQVAQQDAERARFIVRPSTLSSCHVLGLQCEEFSRACSHPCEQCLRPSCGYCV